MPCSGIVDSSGIEFTYIDNPREYDAGVMSISHTEKTMVLPPNANDFSVTGLCPPECTRKVSLNFVCDLLNSFIIVSS